MYHQPPFGASPGSNATSTLKDSDLVKRHLLCASVLSRVRWISNRFHIALSMEQLHGNAADRYDGVVVSPYGTQPHFFFLVGGMT